MTVTLGSCTLLELGRQCQGTAEGARATRRGTHPGEVRTGKWELGEGQMGPERPWGGKAR